MSERRVPLNITVRTSVKNKFKKIVEREGSTVSRKLEAYMEYLIEKKRRKNE